MDFGKKIRDRREDLDYSQKDMAAMIPMNQSNYSKIERGIQEPSMEQLRRICQILKLDPRYLLELDDFEGITAQDIKTLRQMQALINGGVKL